MKIVARTMGFFFIRSVEMDARLPNEIVPAAAPCISRTFAPVAQRIDPRGSEVERSQGSAHLHCRD
jgi:hypothetical protein